MADIFISYAKKDRDKAEQLASALQALGWTVWWDHEIPPGEDFDEVIEEELNRAGSVVVLWSERSKRSKYVKGEAREAQTQKKLIPAFIEQVKPPMDLRAVQGVFLDDWNGQKDFPAIKQLNNAVARLLGSSSTELTRSTQDTARSRTRSARQGERNKEKISDSTDRERCIRTGEGGNQTRCFHVGEDLLVIGNDHRHRIHDVRMSSDALDAIKDFKSVDYIPERRIELLRCQGPNSHTKRDEAASILQGEYGVRFASRGLRTVDGRWAAYSNNIIVLFDENIDKTESKRILSEYDVTLGPPLLNAKNMYLAAVSRSSHHDVFRLTTELLTRAEVSLCYPEIFQNAMAFPQQWHLQEARINGRVVKQHASVKDAWKISEGEGITVAIIADNFDLLHEEFVSADKIVAPRTNAIQTNNSDDRLGNWGTAIAGIACANGHYGAAGVAPKARLMPIQVVRSSDEGSALIWATTNGADVICFSTGPPSGEWWNPDDPAHDLVGPLLDSTREGIKYAIENGRGGKGCVIVTPVGVGNEDADANELVSHEKTIAVGACNDHGIRSPYSDSGNSIWCVFPSSNGEPSLTPGIWTTDVRRSIGSDNGDDDNGQYTSKFGGTDAAASGVAGTIALMLSANPELRWDEVTDILKGSSEKIDRAGGQYDESGHSPYYGYGRVNARSAVELARDYESTAP